MKYGIIGVGSNSVKLLIVSGGTPDKKITITTQIAEGLATIGLLQDKPMQETKDAVKSLVSAALKLGARKVYAFATEAVRAAQNGEKFCDMIKNETGLILHVITKEEEAIAGFYGAYRSGNTCVIDIGGASTEIAEGCEQQLNYIKSLPIGVVRLRDLVGENIPNLQAYIKACIVSFNTVPATKEVVAIGGTACSIVSITKKLVNYNAEEVNNYLLTKKEVEDCFNLVSNTPLSKRGSIIGLSEKRQNTIVGGSLLLLELMNLLKVDVVRVSENDNLLGYYRCFVEKIVNVPKIVERFDTGW